MAKQIWKYEPSFRWVKAEKNDVILADSKETYLLMERLGEEDYYFPKDHVKMEYFKKSDYIETSGYRGTKIFWDLDLKGQNIEKAAFSYEKKEGRPDLSDYIALSWNSMDHWYEEEEEVFLHPRNPYHRVDTIKSSRHIEVFVDDTKIADSHNPYILFETHIKPRYYIPDSDVKMDLLNSSDTKSVCPYKGFASYYNINAGSIPIEDAVWYYPDPLREAPKLKGNVAFWNEKDKRIKIIVDGEEVK